MLSEIIIEAFAGIMTKNEMELNAEEYDDLNTSDMLTTYQGLYNSNVQRIELLINETIRLPISFIIGSSFVGGSLIGSILTINLTKKN